MVEKIKEWLRRLKKKWDKLLEAHDGEVDNKW